MVSVNGTAKILEGQEVLELGHPSASQSRPTYNVTVHRKKVHAITQFPRTSVHQTPTRSSFSTSTISAHSDSESHELGADYVPTMPTTQTQTDISSNDSNPLKDSRLLQMLGNDAELLQALQLYYSKDPAKMFKNSPLRPDFWPRSASEGDLNKCPFAIRASGPNSLDLSAAQTLDENSENASILTPLLQTVAPVIPLNIQPRNAAAKSSDFRTSGAFFDGPTNLQFGSTTDAPPRHVFPHVNTDDLRLSSPRLFDVLFSNPLASYNNTGTLSTDSFKENPPTSQAPLSVRVSSPKSSIVLDNSTLLMDPDEDKENQPPPKSYYGHATNDPLSGAPPDPNHKGDLESAYQQDIPPSPPHPSHGAVFRTPLSARSLSLVKSKSDKPPPSANSQSASRSPTKTLRSLAGSEIVDAYANMTTCGTDSEEEELIESAVIATWQSARLTSNTHSSPSDHFSPSSTLSPLSAASTSEVETPSVLLDRRRMSWSPESKKSHLTRKDANTATHIQNDASDAELRIRSSLDNDAILLESSALPSPRFSPPTRPRNRRMFRSYSVSIDPAEYPSPHRGIVGLDGGSNREAFLYGAEDDETFTRKLDLRMASLDDGASTAHEQRLTPRNTPRRVDKGVVRYSTPLNDTGGRKRYDAANHPFSLSPAASVHIDGQVETRRSRSRHKFSPKQTFSNKLGLSPSGAKINQSVDVFGAVIHSQMGTRNPHHRQVSPTALRPRSVAAKLSPSRIPRLRALEQDSDQAVAFSPTIPVMSLATRSDGGLARTFPRPRTGSLALRPGDRMAFGARIAADRHLEPRD